MSLIHDNIVRVRENVARAAEKAGRNPCDVAILAATKTIAPEDIKLAIESGIDAIGENRVQELLQKKPLIPPCPVHFIGRLQRNKVKFVAGLAELIHSADSPELCEALNRQYEKMDICGDILIEINIGNEHSKTGFSPDDARKIPEIMSKYDHLRVRGLMCIPPAGLNEYESEKTFEKTRQLYVDIRSIIMDNSTISAAPAYQSGFDMLSMGMSGDYEAAVRQGATIIRLGTAIFGSRMSL